MNVYHLRDMYPRFIYHSFQISETDSALELVYHFEIPKLAHFRPSWTFPKPQGPVKLRKEMLENYVFNLGLIELLSYWKLVCCPIVDLRLGQISEEQGRFWKALYLSGLGEFKHLNKIDIPDEQFINFSQESVQHHEISLGSQELDFHGLLIPVGGGKDSIVSLEKLRPLATERHAYAINANPAIEASMDIAGIRPEQRILPKRQLDKRLIELNAEGFLNGHTPFSAIVAFSASFAAALYGLRDIVLSNESSANEATVKDSEVNHQYSKTSEFETNFNTYLQSYLNPKQRYFSLLRPFSELAIARQFSKYPAYFKAFRSCNVGSKKNAWCGKCAKCLFVGTMLLPFLGKDKVHEIIGAEIFENEQLSEMMDELCGFTAEKPFECVGTVHEVKLALVLYLKQELTAARVEPEAFSALPKLLRRFALNAYKQPSEDLYWNDNERRFVLRFAASDPLNHVFEGHHVPDEYWPYLSDFLKVGEEE